MFQCAQQVTIIQSNTFMCRAIHSNSNCRASYGTYCCQSASKLNGLQSCRTCLRVIFITRTMSCMMPFSYYGLLLLSASLVTIVMSRLLIVHQCQNSSDLNMSGCSCCNIFVSSASQCFSCTALVVWRIGNIVGRINEVTLRRAGLVLRWVTVRRYTVLVSNQATQAHSAWPSLCG